MTLNGLESVQLGLERLGAALGQGNGRHVKTQWQKEFRRCSPFSRLLRRNRWPEV
jgi:hypothetical protein